MLRVDGLEEPDLAQGLSLSPSNFRLSSRHGPSIITTAYYYSIVLLTTPFLTLQVRQASGKETQTTGNSSTIVSLAPKLEGIYQRYWRANDSTLI